MIHDRRLSLLAVWLGLFAAAVLCGASHAAANESPADEQALIEVLRTGDAAEKALACKQLALYGTRQAVPELALLLADEHLNSWARIALEAIPDAAADEALRKAAESLSGPQLVGTINSIGVRRNAGAIEQLIRRLHDADTQVAQAAAVALGRIARPAALEDLRSLLTADDRALRRAAAEGCILYAERLTAAGNPGAAREIYDDVRQADVGKPAIAEATRGAILARGPEGIPLLIEQLTSDDKLLLQIGLSTARELPGREVAAALSAEIGRAAPARAASILYAIADRADVVASSEILQAAQTGDPQVRIAAVFAIGRCRDATGLPVLLKVAAEPDPELSQAALEALTGLPGEQVDKVLVARLPTADGPELRVLIDLIGQRRVDATTALGKLIDHSDASIRAAALTALGETTSQAGVPVLLAQVRAPRDADDAAVAGRALRAACVRMPDREACAAELAAAMPHAPIAAQTTLIEILGAMGGPKALATIAASINGSEELRQAGSRVLGGWMTVDAAPLLLEMAKNDPSDKYRTRALRGYIRLARQFAMPTAERAAMCRQALAAARRAPEQNLVLAVLERYPSIETLAVTVEAAETPPLHDEAVRVAQVIATKMKDTPPAAIELLEKVGLHPVKIEILKAEYGAGEKTKDVTEVVRRGVSALPLINLPAKSYNECFDGDPAPGVVKKLTLQYRIDGKSAEASFQENAALLLPMPPAP